MSAFNPGVRRREVLAWAMYDFANSGYTTVILTAVFSTYFVGVVAAGHAWGTFAWTCALSVSYLMVMLSMPWLGARADARAAKRRLLFTSTVGCIIATSVLAFVGPGAIALGLVAIAISNYCYCVGESAVASFLPELARPQALGRVSGWGWGFGYFGGMLTLGIALAIVTQASGRDIAAQDYVPWVVVTTCVVFALAAVPAFLLLKERSQPAGAAPALPAMLTRLRSSWR
ncbi:MAG: MFS transporter, partial [Burkholderiaceae bacterium]